MNDSNSGRAPLASAPLLLIDGYNLLYATDIIGQGSNAGTLQASLYTDENSIIDRLGTARRELEALSEIDESLGPHLESLNELVYGVEDLAGQLRHYADQLEADPERLEFWKTKLGEKSGRPKVGLSWSSSWSNPLRDRYYATIEEMAPVLSIGGLDFTNLQSHDSSADIEQAKNLYGANIHTWDGLDLRNDLDGVAALTAALDLVISFPTFGAEFAGALGVPTLCFCHSDTHIDFLGTGNSVWQPAIRYVTKTRDVTPLHHPNLR